MGQYGRGTGNVNGRHVGAQGFNTDFASDSARGLLGLRAMVEHAQPDHVDTVADHWLAVKAQLLSAKADLDTHTSAALTHWEGDAAEGFAARSKVLSESLSNSADYVHNVSTGLTIAASALRTAKATMPTVPSEFDRAKRYAMSETNDQQFKSDIGSGMSRSAALQLEGNHLSLMEERHQQAVVVMSNLEDNYGESARIIGVPPQSHNETWKPWPPAPPIVSAPVNGKNGKTVSDPKLVGSSSSRSDKVVPTPHHVDDVVAPKPGGPGGSGDTGPGSGIAGGSATPPPPPPGTTLSGVHDGLHTTVGDTGGGGGLTGVGGIGGFGGGGGGNGIGSGGGGAVGGMGFGGMGGGMAGGEGGAGGARRVGFAGEAEAGVSGSTKAGGAAEGEGSIGARGEERAGAGAGEGRGSGQGGGMGGMGGAGGKGKKGKRRGRAQYLVEDEESWESGNEFNPPVIG